jgi:hypothetical protein
MLALNHDCLTQLNPQLQPPLYRIGQKVATGEGFDAKQGIIVGLKLSRRHNYSSWSYLIEFGSDEVWSPEADLIPLDGSSLFYQQRWHISAKAWGDEFLYEVFDLETEVEATGLRLFATAFQAIIAGKHFIRRELLTASEERGS